MQGRRLNGRAGELFEGTLEGQGIFETTTEVALERIQDYVCDKSVCQHKTPET